MATDIIQAICALLGAIAMSRIVFDFIEIFYGNETDKK